MRNYHVSASSAARYEYGVELYEGLARFPETAHAATLVHTINEALHAQFQKRVSLVVPVVKARAALRFADYHKDGVMRSAYHAAQVEAGGRNGALVRAIFPDGVRAMARSAEPDQAKSIRDVIERLMSSNLAGIDDYRNTWLPKLRAAHAQLETAMTSYDEATKAHREAFIKECELRDAHFETMDRAMGIVREAFPRDRDMHEVIFPLLQRARARAEQVEKKAAAMDNESL